MRQILMAKDMPGTGNKLSGKFSEKETIKGRKKTAVSNKDSIKKLSPASSPFIHPSTTIDKKTGGAPKTTEKSLQPTPDKIKLQLFPVNEATCKLLQEGGHNPYLELTLRPRKKISSVLTHLISKWVISRTDYDLTLFPYGDQKVDSQDQKTWSLNDKETTATDVYSAVGRPQIFRLRYGLRHDLEKNEQTETNNCRNVVEIEGKEELASGHETGPLHMPGKPVVNTEKGVNTLLSWVDCVTSISVGQLLVEAPKVNQTCQLVNSSSKQMVNSDSFDAAIASLMARTQDSLMQQPTLSSIWEAEETRHAFPAARHTFSEDQNSPASQRIAVLDHKMEEPEAKAKLDSQTDELQAPHPGSLNFCWDSLGPFGFGGLIKPVTGAEGTSLSSLDPFQTCSLFAMETTPST